MTTTVAASPRARDVADLTVSAAYPCISVLMSTEPGPRMTDTDQDRLAGLVATVEQELREQGVLNRAQLVRSLWELALRAAGQPTDRGLAIYVSLAVQRTFRLTLSVPDRALVEQTFATRPLLTSLHRMPTHALLVLHPGSAELHEVTDESLRSVVAVEAPAGAGDAFLRDVDDLLGAYREQHPSPLVLAGDPVMASRFRSLSRNMTRFAGEVPVGRAVDPEALARASCAAVSDYLRSRRQEALEIFREALARCPGDVATGMAACWTAVHDRRPGMLLVEEGYVSPSDGSSGGAVHDLVDDLMEVVIMRGGQVALTEDGDLADHGRIALISRPNSWRPGPRTSPG